MPVLTGNLVKLRALEPQDVDILYQWENDPEVWEVSHTQTPFPKHLLETFIKVAAQDIYTNKQLRLMIDELQTGKTIGAIDLFDFEPMHDRVGVGILIDKNFREKGYATEAICLVKNYVFDVLFLHQIYCNILEENEKSITLFVKEGFELVGNKKEWIKTCNGFKNELLFQCIKK